MITKNNYKNHLAVFNKCITICQSCLEFILEIKTNSDYKKDCLDLLLDCIEICSLTIKYLKNNSLFIPEICHLCSNICRKCATACDKLPHKRYQKCTQICQQCITHCQSIIHQINQESP